MPNHLHPGTHPPTYGLHKPTGQAVTTLNGKDCYLGKHNPPASREAYDRCNRRVADQRTPTGGGARRNPNGHFPAVVDQYNLYRK